MILKYLKLENIRSYLSQTLEFPEGSVLLAGDIGAGKSTILLAIEFALFGMKKKGLSASQLLRHGKKEGSVELAFSINNVEVVIKRNLKRGKDDIKQEAGYILRNGLKKEATHIELRSMALELLGYPSDLLKKSNDLIYRYTVYTPQEEMKQILIEDKDLRLDTLRRVFNIDRYKRIRENAEIIFKELRDTKKNSEGRVADLEDKKKQLEAEKKQVKDKELQLEMLKPGMEEIKALLQEKQKELLRYEKDIEANNKLVREYSLIEQDLKNKAERLSFYAKETEKLDKEIVVLTDDLKGKDVKDAALLKEEIKLKNAEINIADKKLIKIRHEVSAITTKRNSSAEVKSKIAKIDSCPLCLQQVSHEHKTGINKKEDNAIAVFDKELLRLNEEEKKLAEKSSVLKEQMLLLQKEEGSISLIRLKLKNKEDKEKIRGNYALLMEKLRKDTEEMEKEKISLRKGIDALASVKEKYKKARADYDTLVEKDKKISLELNSFEKEREGSLKVAALLEKDIEQKAMIKKKLDKIAQWQHWLNGFFIKLMNTVEKHVLMQLHLEFNELFQNWFDILLEDESISIRLDDEFTPVIEQNGYETSIENLSGGERTAVALAYRLALNKVINNLISTINTKDILILDEPTEGFSTEQLDKVREVLDEINIKQVIIVSHESKIEGFVDKVIRISKREHVSEVV